MAGHQTCATRESIAFSRYGYDLTCRDYTNGSAALNNIVNRGWNAKILNSDASITKRHIIISAEVMTAYIKGKIIENSETIEKDVLDFTTPEEYYDVEHESKVPAYRPKAGGIVLFADNVHVGICHGDDPGKASFMSGNVCLLYRSTWA